jgi:uncharacterized protein YgbK (DUF1537 family)
VSRFVVIADDRTGAMETAGACADVGCEAVVTPFSAGAPDAIAECVVIDLGSRHLTGAEAAARAGAAPVDAAHKIDSTLRGNWAHEVVGRRRASGRRVLMIPAFPAAGRTCADGVVLVDGRPVSESDAANDPRGGVGSSRPSEHLLQAGAPSVDVVSRETVSSWLSGSTGEIAVCDATTDDDLRAAVSIWASHRNVVLAGTAATLAWGADALLRPRRLRPSPPVCAGPVLIVCGSLHPMARAQAATAVSVGATVLVSDPAENGDAGAVAAALGDEAREALAANAFGTVVLVGGDTAAAVLGDTVVRVGGTVAPGVAWSRPWGDRGPLVLTKPGGFGTASTLVDVLGSALR